MILKIKMDQKIKLKIQMREKKTAKIGYLAAVNNMENKEVNL